MKNTPWQGIFPAITTKINADESINAVTRQHYAEQLSAYSELIQRATGAPVTARWILHLSSSGATEFEV